jgi:ElaB/YqjD/DUF883 family membrane-anchored ribosome-binding protein
MVRSKFEDAVDAVREGVPQYAARGGKAYENLRGQVEEAIDDAAPEARRLKRRLGRAVSKRIDSVDRVGRENAFIMAVGALGIGIVIGYLLSRDRD